MEKRTEVKTFLVKYICDGCNEGEMIPMGIMLPSNPPEYKHACNKCGKEKNFKNKTYPYKTVEYV